MTEPIDDTISFRRRTFLIVGAAALAFVVLTVTFASGVAVGRHTGDFAGRSAMMQQGFRDGVQGGQQDGRGWGQGRGGDRGYHQ